MTQPPVDSTPTLKRELGVFGAMMMGLGSIVGTGVFVSIGIAAGMAGPSVVLAIGVAAFVATCNAFSSAQLAAIHPVSGGTYEYGHKHLNPSLGFTAGWMFLCANRGAGGVDGQTVEHLRAHGVERFVDELQEDLKAKRYRPSPVRRVYIPKPDGRQRPLGIPTLRDRVAQMAVKLVILTRTEEAAQRYFGWLEPTFQRMGLEINREKTRIARVSEGFDFLGLTFKEGRGRGTGRRFALSYPRPKAMQAIRQKIKDTARQHALSAPIREVIVDLNRTLDGWGNYFAGSNASRHFEKIDLYALDQVRLFLRRKHQRKDSRGHRTWPVGFLYQKLGLTRLTGSLTTRRNR